MDRPCNGGWQTTMSCCSAPAYEHFLTLPKHAQNPYAQALEDAQKFVTSTPCRIRAIEAQPSLGQCRRCESPIFDDGPGVGGHGRRFIIQSLMAHDLVEQYMLMVHPVVSVRDDGSFADGKMLSVVRPGRVHADHDQGDRRGVLGPAARGLAYRVAGFRKTHSIRSYLMNVLAVEAYDRRRRTRFFRSTQSRRRQQVSTSPSARSRRAPAPRS